MLQAGVLVTSHVLVLEMESRLTVIAGNTYREPSQVFNRCVLPVYQTSYRWTGSRLDAEDVTSWVITREFTRLDLPRPAMAVDEQLLDAAAQSIGKHWRDRYGISPVQWSALGAGEVAAPWRAALGLRALLDPLPAELRLVTVLRFLRRRTLGQIASQLSIAPQAAAILMFRALDSIGAEMGLGQTLAVPSQAAEVAAFVDHIVTRRRPPRFQAAASSFPALLAATFVHAAIAGNDLPRARFVRSLEDALSLGGSPIV